MSLYTALAVGVVVLYFAPSLIRRLLMRRKHKVFHYIEYNLYGDDYTTRENGALNEFIADAVLWQIEQAGGAVTFHFKRMNLDNVQSVIDQRYEKELQRSKSKTHNISR